MSRFLFGVLLLLLTGGLATAQLAPYQPPTLRPSNPPINPVPGNRSINPGYATPRYPAPADPPSRQCFIQCTPTFGGGRNCYTVCN